MKVLSLENPELYFKVKRLSENSQYDAVHELLAAVPRDKLLGDPQLAMYEAGALRRLYRAADAWQLLIDLKPYVLASGDANALRRWCNGYAMHLLYSGKIEEAKQSLLQSLGSAETANDYRSIAFACNSLGIVESTIGEVEQALQHYRRAVAAWQRIGSAHDVGLAIFNMAVVYRECGLLENASKHFLLSQEYLTVHGTAVDLLFTRLERTMFLIALGDLTLAETAAKYTLARADEMSSEMLRTRAQRVLGAALLANGKWREAKAWLEAALRAIREEPNRLLEADLCEDLAVVAWAEGQAEEFNRYRTIVYSYFEGIGAPRHVRRAKARLELPPGKLQSQIAAADNSVYGKPAGEILSQYRDHFRRFSLRAAKVSQ